jgi:hypothetical protein
MILNNNKLNNSLLIKKFQTGGKAGFDPYAGLYTTVKSESSSTNQIPQNIRNLKEEEDKKANEIIRIKEAKEKEARRIKEIKEKIRLRRENPDMMTGISDAEAKDLAEKSERLENPTIGDRLEQLGKAPARYITNPLRALGDFDYAMHGNTQLPNTVKERETDIKSKLYNSPEEKKKLEDLKKEELKGISIDAAIEAGTLGAGKLIGGVYKGAKKISRAKNINKIRDAKGTTIYSGSPYKFKQFDPSKIGSVNDKGNPMGVWFTDDKGIAKVYSKETGSTFGNLLNSVGLGNLKGYKPTVYMKNAPKNLKTKTVDFKGAYSSDALDKNKIVKDAWDEGYESVLLNNIKDGSPIPHNVSVFKDPSKVWNQGKTSLVPNNINKKEL